LPLPNAQPQPVGNVTIAGAQQALTPAQPNPNHVYTNLDDALRFTLNHPGSFVIVGAIIQFQPNPPPNAFRLYQLAPPQLPPNPAPPVIDFVQANLEIAAIVFDHARVAYFRSHPLQPTRRWVAVPRLREFYMWAPQDQTAQRTRWIRRLRLGRIRVGNQLLGLAELRRLSVPALRILLAAYGGASQTAGELLVAQRILPIVRTAEHPHGVEL
jgi:hypothetical protein